MLLSSFLKLVESTPFKVIQEHSKIVVACAGCLTDLFKAVSQENWDSAIVIHEKIVAMEHEADLLKRDIRQNLTRNLMLPVDRTDILELIVMQDRIANITKDVSGLLVERKMVLPSLTQPTWFLICEQTVKTCEHAKRMVEHLNIIIETGFARGTLGEIQKMLKDLDESEHASDLLQSSVREALFQCESKLSPVDVVFLYHINHQMGLISDVCQNVGARFLLMVSV